MKYLFIPHNSSEYWTIAAVCLEITAADAAQLRALSAKTTAACVLTGAQSCRYRDEIVTLTAIETMKGTSAASDWVEEQHETDEYHQTYEDFDPQRHECWGTDKSMLIWHNGDIYFTLRNHYGEGELEVSLPAELYAEPAAA